MKNIINLTFVFSIISCSIYAQDSLAIKHLEPLTYTFSIVNGKLTGSGKMFLEQEMAKAQFTMIGEYHGSKRISKFTTAIIPVLNGLDYKTMVLEVGPITGQLLNTLGNNVEVDLKQLHNKYITKESDGYVSTPFPFFDTKEDAQFLQTAKDNSWTVLGIDQEYYDGYVMLADKMYNNLPKVAQKAYNELYTKTISELKQLYKDDQNDKQNLHVALSNSELYQEFTQKMASEPKNLEIIEALKESSEIYLLNEKRKWYENNATRIKYMKLQLKKGLENINFDLSEDKLLIKMGGYHLSKGFSPLGLYEVGNTLNEIAEYHGNTTLNIGFMSRFYMEENELKDAYSSENKYYKNHKALLQMGQKDQWVIIDLRPLIKGYFYYPQKFHLNEQIVKLIQRYDVLVIPKIEIDGTPNYD